MKTHALVLIFFQFILILACNAAYANAEEAQEIVRETADQVIARLSKDRENLEANPDQIYSLVDELIIPHFDFVSMSKWVLGKTNWKSANETQQEQFVNEFRTLLVRTYAKALLEYSKQEIKYLPVENNPESTIVLIKTEIQQPGAKTVPINYSMHASGGDWKVIDVAVDGISLVATYRGSFASEIRKSGMDGLISKLVERNTAATTHASSQ